MTALASVSLDSMDDQTLVELADQVRALWQPRDEAIASAVELRTQKWVVPVPEGWKQTAKTQHTAMSKEIPERVVGTSTLREPQFSRTPPDDDERVQEASNTVERFHAAMWQYARRTAVPGQSSYMFAWDQMANKGARCAGSVFAPHSYWGVPTFSEKGAPAKAWWRDEAGRETADQESMDWAATARAYMKQVDLYRRHARPPIIRREVPTEQAYPLFLDGQLHALFIMRQATPFELMAGGFLLADQPGGASLLTGQRAFTEVWTANRCRYYLDRQPLSHRVFGAEGVVHRYGFVPFVYRVGIAGGASDYGAYGTPLLGLIDSNLRMIDTMLTYQFNAIHLASFPSFYLEYVVRDGVTSASVVEAQTGKRMSSYEFKSGTIMDFGPDRKVVPFLHPGLNPDFYKFLQWQMEEVQRIIPRTLQGQAESSGYNTVQSTVQAKAIFNPMADAMEMCEAELGLMDLQHLVKRVGGPVYLNLELGGGVSSRPRHVQQVRVEPKDVGDYYDVTVSIDRELDRITLGTWAAGLADRGYVDSQFVQEVSGINDPQTMRMRIIRDGLFKDPIIQQAMRARAVERFGLQQAVAEAAASGRIQVGADGTPQVQMEDGAMFGPGQALPQNQGMAGAMLGGLNTTAVPGGPNLSSTANPNIAQPSATPTGRPRSRRRGGAIPGAPQRQGMTRPEPQALGA